MTSEVIYAAALKVADLIADGRYDDAVNACSTSRLSAADIGGVVSSYARTFVRLPNNYSEYVDVVGIIGCSPPAWSVGVPLWTAEEGRSDLTLELTVTDEPAEAKIELDDLRTL